jgi:hypothetical protein
MRIYLQWFKCLLLLLIPVSLVLPLPLVVPIGGHREGHEALHADLASGLIQRLQFVRRLSCFWGKVIVQCRHSHLPLHFICTMKEMREKRYCRHVILVLSNKNL